MEKTNDKNPINQILLYMCAEINTGKYQFTAFENRYRIDVIKKNIFLFLPSPSVYLMYIKVLIHACNIYFWFCLQLYRVTAPHYSV